MNERARLIVRARLNEITRQKVEKPHVEFCTECGKACDRTGRRSASICVECSRKGRES